MREVEKAILKENAIDHQMVYEKATIGVQGELPGTDTELEKNLLQGNHSVLVIRGESGMGKTTLAEKLYYNPQIRDNFEAFAWVSLKKDFRTRDVLQEILSQLIPERRIDVKEMDVLELTHEIFNLQMSKKCLVVLDNIWSPEDWLGIRVAFPSTHKSISKIIVTTPLKEVADVVAPSGRAYEMKQLNEAECMEILKKKADFINQAEIDEVGKKIFMLSKGSPQIAVILGKAFKPINAAAMTKAAGELDSYARRSQSSSHSEKEWIHGLLDLCYNRLEHDLKPCFLYLGQFPENDNLIEVERLSLLFAAESFVTANNLVTWDTLTKKMGNVLEDLVKKGLIEVRQQKVSWICNIKPCRLHDQIRDFCVSKALKERYFQVIDFKEPTKVGATTLRMAIHLSKYEYGCTLSFESPVTIKKIRSLLIFDDLDQEQKSTWPQEISDLVGLVALRVLDFQGINFCIRKLPKGIEKPAHLRYLSFQGCYLEVFPLPYGNYLFLETLDLRVFAENKMIIPNNILSQMKNLKRLYFPALYVCEGKKKLQIQGMEGLQVLVNFDTRECMVEDLFKLNKLEILAIISDGSSKILGEIISLLNRKESIQLLSSFDIRNFDCYVRDKDETLRNLLACRSLRSLNIEGLIGCLPKQPNISPNFVEIVLSGSELEDDLIAIFGKLQNLQRLVLSEDAFVGSEMTFTAASGFPNLAILKLLNLQYLEKLEFEEGTCPRLSSLMVQNCDSLEEVMIADSINSRLELGLAKRADTVYLVQPLPTITTNS